MRWARPRDHQAGGASLEAMPGASSAGARAPERCVQARASPGHLPAVRSPMVTPRTRGGEPMMMSCRPRHRLAGACASGARRPGSLRASTQTLASLIYLPGPFGVRASFSDATPAVRCPRAQVVPAAHRPSGVIVMEEHAAPQAPCPHCVSAARRDAGGTPEQRPGIRRAGWLRPATPTRAVAVMVGLRGRMPGNSRSIGIGSAAGGRAMADARPLSRIARDRPPSLGARRDHPDERRPVSGDAEDRTLPGALPGP